MQTNLPSEFLDTKQGSRVNEILRTCVHCGFCNATCPTHQLTGDELDGPRGRIYLLKEMFEGNDVSQSTLAHLDSCLHCLNCETTCPSGVRFGELAELGKHALDKKPIRNWLSRFKRWGVCLLFPYPNRFRPIYLLGKWMRLAPNLTHINDLKFPQSKLPKTAKEKVILLSGCVQSVVAPHINTKLQQILSHAGIASIIHEQVKCCGAIHHHNGQSDNAVQIMKQNIDSWWNDIEQGCTAIVITASGCGSVIKDYYRLLVDDPEYADKAKVISNLTKDASEYLANFKFKMTQDRSHIIAFHPPCTLQHDQKVSGIVESLLSNAGYEMVEFRDKHFCCGSAGTYSILQPEMATQLRKNKLKNIEEKHPHAIVTANIGCLLHLQEGTSTPVRHWLELVDFEER